MRARFEIDRDSDGRLIFQRYEKGAILRAYSLEVDEEKLRPIIATAYEGGILWWIKTKGIAIIG